MNKIQRFRSKLRAKVTSRYSGLLHVFWINLVCLAFCVGVYSLLISPAGWGLMATAGLIIALVFGNFVEYSVHRWLMHKKVTGFKFLYDKHCREHHMFYDEEHMNADSKKDFYFLLFPWWAGPFIVSLGGALFMLALWALSVPTLFVAGFGIGVGLYYGVYEWSHLLTHQNNWFGHTLGQPHTTHHRHSIMHDCNFNIMIPLFDRVFGTYVKS